MNSRFSFLRRVRIHDGECGAVARALHHEAKFSSPAVLENVSGTTNERKKMTYKSISFKRVALAVVAALGLGLMATGPSSALPLNPTLTLSAASASIATSESATVTVDVTLTALTQNETVTVKAVSSGGAGAVTAVHFIPLTTDSVNVSAHNVGDTNVTQDTSVVGASAAGTYSRAKWTAAFVNASTAGTITYTIQLLDAANTVIASQPFTLTISAGDTTAVASKTLMYINNFSAIGTAGNGRGLTADSALVVSANTARTGASTATAVGTLWVDFRNASDTNTTTRTGAPTYDVTGSLVVSVSGPGFLSDPDQVGGAGTLGKSVTLTVGETAIIYSDGTAGTMTLTGYFSTSALTQAAKTVTFYSKAVTLTATAKDVTDGGATALSSDVSDSITVGTNLVTFVAKDSAGNVVKDASMNSLPTSTAGFYCVSSDTSIIGTGTGSSATNAWIAATYDTTDGWNCDMVVRKAGTASVTIADETVVANATYKSAEKSFTFAPEVNGTTKGIGTITFDKSSYNTGEKAVITVTVKNSAGNTPGQNTAGGDVYARNNIFPTLIQNRDFSGYGTTSTGAALGFGSGRTGLSLGVSTAFDTSPTFMNGVETFVVLMPTVAGDLTLTGYTTDGTYDTATAVSITVKVVDSNAAAIAAAQAASDAATDAANEAIDAANAATDAANLAAEAADAATVAAEEARDAADAATAAVEELATQVATLMAALKAQITTLANTVAKIAKKVKA